MENQNLKCLICDTKLNSKNDVTVNNGDTHKGGQHYDCSCCGEFVICSGSALKLDVDSNRTEENLKAYKSALEKAQTQVKCLEEPHIVFICLTTLSDEEVDDLKKTSEFSRKVMKRFFPYRKSDLNI